MAGLLATSMVPRSASMVRLTTSMPTPRPERLVTSPRSRSRAGRQHFEKLAVGELGAGRRAGRALRPAPGCARGRGRARRRRSRSALPRRNGAPTSAMRPCAGLPAALRPQRFSRPWSTALRMRWTSGSLSRSIDGLVEFGLLAGGGEARSPCRDRGRDRGPAGGTGRTASRSAACGCPSWCRAAPRRAARFPRRRTSRADRRLRPRSASGGTAR